MVARNEKSMMKLVRSADIWRQLLHEILRKFEKIWVASLDLLFSFLAQSHDPVLQRANPAPAQL